MAEFWLSLSEIPAQGREFSFTDQSLWTDPLEEFGYAYEILRPYQARIVVLPQKKGYLIQGRFDGAVKLPCDRCAEPGTVEMDEEFQLFEETPAEGKPQEQGFLRPSGKTFELDVAGMLWEQFILALPSKLVCTPGCRGICPHCGQNLNLAECACEKESADPRLAALKSLKIK
jgi:uncharacterized protein